MKDQERRHALLVRSGAMVPPPLRSRQIRAIQKQALKDISKRLGELHPFLSRETLDKADASERLHPSLEIG